MNPVEEHRTDVAAFVLLKHLNYDFMVRSLEFDLSAKARRTELDLIGVRLRDGIVDAIEVKVDCDGPDGRDKRKNFRDQVVKRRDSGIFRHVYAAWDYSGPANSSERYAGIGTIALHGLAERVARVGRIERAPPLPLHESLYKDRLWRIVNRFVECWQVHKQERCVFLSCVKCRAWWYPFPMDVWNSHAPDNQVAAEHSFFCIQNPNRARGYVSANFQTDVIMNGAWQASIVRRHAFGTL